MSVYGIPKQRQKNNRPRLCALICAAIVLLLSALPATAATAPNLPTPPIPAINFSIGNAEGTQDIVMTLQILALITVLSVAPAIVLLTTSFTRIYIVLGFIKNAIGVQQAPPNQVVSALALFLTIFTMAPVWNQIYDNALGPYVQGDIAAPVAWERTLSPVREFMFDQTREEELSLMVRLSSMPQPNSPDDVPTLTLIPAYVLSELKTAFQMGVIIYIPFIIVDMIVASVLMSMGMMMLPPSMISLPFKVLLFIMADGWNLVVASLVTSLR